MDKVKVDQDAKPKSKGYGFIEFTTHIAALACLRSLNNHPDVWGSQSRPIVEFSLENVQILR